MKKLAFLFSLLMFFLTTSVVQGKTYVKDKEKETKTISHSSE
jgi:hypothetical protein